MFPEKELVRNGLIDNGWFLLLLYLLLSVFAFFHFFFEKTVRKTLQASISYKKATRYLDQFNPNFRQGSFALNAVFIIIISVFIYELITIQGFQIINSEYSFPFLIILLTTILFFSLMMLPILIVSLLFKDMPLASEYIYNQWIYNRCIGFFLLPVIVFIPFVRPQVSLWFFLTGFFVISLGLIIRYIRGGFILRKYNISYFHILLYLCALEILPLLYVVKVIESLL